MTTETTPETTDAATSVPDPDARRDELRAKIEASERRIAERTLADQAKDAAESAIEYTRKNPLTVVGGAVALGLAIGLMTRPGRRVATRAATGAASAVSGAAAGTANAARNVSTKSVSRFGSLIADAVVAYGMKLIDDALDAGRAGQDALEDFGDSATSKARELRRDAGYLAGSAADKGRSATRRTRRRASRAVRDLTSKVRG